MGKRYIIKVTKLDGRHAGDVYFLQKGGYVTDADCAQFDFTSYKTYGIANRVCKKYKEDNNWYWEDETQRREKRKREGLKVDEWRIHDHESYEPYEIDAYDSI
jgi:hypothetical protein